MFIRGIVLAPVKVLASLVTQGSELMTQYYFTVTDSHGDSFDDANGEECASAAEAISLAETIAWELAADDGHHDGFTVVVSDNKGVEFMRVPVPRIQGPIRGAAGGRGN